MFVNGNHRENLSRAFPITVFLLFIIGLAYIGTMCQYGNSISIIEEQGGFQSVGTVSHEIGHRYCRHLVNCRSHLFI